MYYSLTFLCIIMAISTTKCINIDFIIVTWIYNTIWLIKYFFKKIWTCMIYLCGASGGPWPLAPSHRHWIRPWLEYDIIESIHSLRNEGMHSILFHQYVFSAHTYTRKTYYLYIVKSIDDVAIIVKGSQNETYTIG